MYNCGVMKLIADAHAHFLAVFHSRLITQIVNRAVAIP
jgi:hypothetical protein